MFNLKYLKNWRITLVVLCILDAILTSIFIGALGPEYEANPIMRALLEHGGIPTFLAVKLAITYFFWYITGRVEKPWVLYVTAVLAAIMTYVVFMGILMVSAIYL